MILCRYSEIFLKGDNRAWFERRLGRNVRAHLGSIDARVSHPHSRLLVETDQIQPALQALSHCFGLASMSPAIAVPADIEAIEAAALQAAAAQWERRGRQGTFKVESRRQDKRFPLSSPEISKRVGAAIVERLAIPVDVHRPDFTVGVEIGQAGRAFVFGEVLPGPGGLPVGTGGRVALLLSGGIDSPVAGWLLAKRGAELAPVYFHSFPFTGDRTKEKVMGLARVLARWTGPMVLRVVHFTEVQQALRDAGPAALAVVLYRRMMLRTAAELARRAGAGALATGDSLGQVASQTLENLAVVGAATTWPLFRPLIGFDKSETIALGRRIGTYELSIAPYEDCCSLFVPKHPATRANLAEVLAAEAKLDVERLARELAAGAEAIAIDWATPGGIRTELEQPEALG